MFPEPFRAAPAALRLNALRSYGRLRPRGVRSQMRARIMTRATDQRRDVMTTQERGCSFRSAGFNAGLFAAAACWLYALPGPAATAETETFTDFWVGALNLPALDPADDGVDSERTDGDGDGTPRQAPVDGIADLLEALKPMLNEDAGDEEAGSESEPEERQETDVPPPDIATDILDRLSGGESDPDGLIGSFFDSLQADIAAARAVETARDEAQAKAERSPPPAAAIAAARPAAWPIAMQVPVTR